MLSNVFAKVNNFVIAILDKKNMGSKSKKPPNPKKGKSQMKQNGPQHQNTPPQNTPPQHQKKKVLYLWQGWHDLNLAIKLIKVTKKVQIFIFYESEMSVHTIT